MRIAAMRRRTLLRLTGLFLGLPMVGIGTARGEAGQDFAAYQKAYDLSGVSPVAIFPNANYEQIASLRPDLVIASYLIEENGYDLLSAIAPTLWHDQPRWQDALIFIADAVGKADVATKFIADYDERVKALQGKIRQGQTLAMISFENDTFRIVQSSRMPIFYEEFGFRRTANTPEVFAGEKRYSLEQIDVLADADVIVMMTTPAEGGGRLQGEYDALISAPGWSELPAVKAGKTHYLGYELTYGSPLVALEVLRFAETSLAG